jgi:hypothetical protein
MESAASAEKGDPEFEPWVQRVMEIYEDVGANRPKDVGGADTYRKRQYRLDRYVEM